MEVIVIYCGFLFSELAVLVIVLIINGAGVFNDCASVYVGREGGRGQVTDLRPSQGSQPHVVALSRLQNRLRYVGWFGGLSLLISPAACSFIIFRLEGSVRILLFDRNNFFIIFLYFAICWVMLAKYFLFF